MEGFIDRLAGFLRMLLGTGDDAPSRSSQEPGGWASGDPDLRDAWQELDDYMKGGTREGASQSRGRESRGTPPRMDESLRQDYANLEVSFGADMETVKKSYKALMLRYHPDKHAGDPEKQRVALEITKKINESFERIRSHH